MEELLTPIGRRVIPVRTRLKISGQEAVKESAQAQIRVRQRNESRPGVDTSVDAANVGVCATTSVTRSPTLEVRA